jgi:2-hydroxychromene-2-carboxylate isomerase
MWRDLARLCVKHRLPWRQPSVFPRSSVLAARVALASGERIVEVSKALFRLNFAEDRDIADPLVVGEIVDPDVLARASSPEMKSLLRANTDEAVRLGFFGAPNLMVGGEHFFGQDRLEDALGWEKSCERHGPAGPRL